MCRNIKRLANLDPPATNDEVRDAALQFVRKLSGVQRPSRANQEVFERAVDEIAEVAGELLRSLMSGAPARTREEEAERARARSARRFPVRAPGEPQAQASLGDSR